MTPTRWDLVSSLTPSTELLKGEAQFFTVIPTFLSPLKTNECVFPPAKYETKTKTGSPSPSGLPSLPNSTLGFFGLALFVT